MKPSNLNPELEARIALLFPSDQREWVRQILQNECGRNLAFCQNEDEIALNRIRFAALKLSDGDLTKLGEVVELAKCDWRDLLVSAGFAEDLRSYKEWTKTLVSASQIQPSAPACNGVSLSVTPSAATSARTPVKSSTT